MLSLDYTHLTRIELSLPPALKETEVLHIPHASVDIMSPALGRTTLKLGMIPADGIGKEVLPVSSSLFTLSVSTIEE